MAERPTTPPSPSMSGDSAGDRLDSWKEIAAYLNRDVTTVQRWERREGMPVQRHLHDKKGSVYAFRVDLDAWMRGRNLQAEEGDAEEDALGPLSDPSLNGSRKVVSDADSSSIPTAVRDERPSRSGWKVMLALSAAGVLIACAVVLWLQRSEYFWRSPIADARVQTVTDFGGIEEAAAISRDGRLVAFLSDRDGKIDVWLTQVGSGEFHNLTHGSQTDIVNPSIRTLGFSPDAGLVTFWARRQNQPGGEDISVWAVPVLGGEPRLYLENAAEYDWSRDGSQLAYHTPGPGDPLFVADGVQRAQNRRIFVAPAGLHAHFPLWGPDAKFIYFVQGELPDKLDVWRISPQGGTAERITLHSGRVSYPVLLDEHTLLYLASEPDGSGPWLYSMDLRYRRPHRLASALDRYTSLAASADGRRLVATLATPYRTLWRMAISAQTRQVPGTAPISLPTASGFSPRLGPDYLLYVSTNGVSDSIWKLSNGAHAELWSHEGARVLDGPAVSRDGSHIAFVALEHGKSLLYVIQADGTNPRVVTDSLDLQGAPAWPPDGQSITVGANDHGVPHLLRVPLSGGAPAAFVNEYSIDPTFSPDGQLVVYSGPDIGTTFSVKAAGADAAPHAMPALTLTRGARHLAFLPGGKSLLVLRGEIQHKNLWLIDLETGAEQQLTSFAPDFDIRDFDVSADGHEVILERFQERADIVLLDLPR